MSARKLGRTRHCISGPTIIMDGVDGPHGERRNAGFILIVRGGIILRRIKDTPNNRAAAEASIAKAVEA